MHQELSDPDLTRIEAAFKAYPGARTWLVERMDEYISQQGTADNIDAMIADWIAAQVEWLGLRYDEEFKAVGVTRPWHSRVRSRKTRPSIRSTVFLCARAGISFDDSAAGVRIHQPRASGPYNLPGITLRSLREQAGLSLKKLSDKVGASHPLIAKIGKWVVEDPKLRTVVLLDKALNANGALLASFWRYYADDILDPG